MYKKEMKEWKCRLTINSKQVLVNSPWQGPFSGIGIGFAALCAWQPPCLWGGKEAALGLQQCKLNALLGTLGLKRPMGWQHHPTLTEEPRCAAVDAIQPQRDPPCCLPIERLKPIGKLPSLLLLLLGHMCFSCYRTYVMILCNWLILWRNAFYLYLGRLRMCLTTWRNHVSRSSVEAFNSVQEIKQECKFIKARQLVDTCSTPLICRGLRTSYLGIHESVYEPSFLLTLDI